MQVTPSENLDSKSNFNSSKDMWNTGGINQKFK